MTQAEWNEHIKIYTRICEPWTPEEDEALKRGWAESGPDGAVAALPLRSPSSIRQRGWAHHGLKVPDKAPAAGGRYTPEEDAIILEEIAKPELGWAERAHLRLPHRSVASINGRAGMIRPRPGAAPLPIIEQRTVIVGWRVWRAVTNGRDAVLRSIWTGTPWPVGQPFATTDIEQRPASDDGERNGAHAFKWLPTIKDYGYALPEPKAIGGETLVHGTVSLWGRCIEHERGYRAEFAYPQFICTCTGIDLARAIVRSYGIDTAACAATLPPVRVR